MGRMRVRGGTALLLASLILLPTSGAWFGASWLRKDSFGDQDDTRLVGLFSTSNKSATALAEAEANATATQADAARADERVENAHASRNRTWLRSVVLGARSFAPSASVDLRNCGFCVLASHPDAWWNLTCKEAFHGRNGLGADVAVSAVERIWHL